MNTRGTRPGNGESVVVNSHAAVIAEIGCESGNGIAHHRHSFSVLRTELGMEYCKGCGENIPPAGQWHTCTALTDLVGRVGGKKVILADDPNSPKPNLCREYAGYRGLKKAGIDLLPGPNGTIVVRGNLNA